MTKLELSSLPWKQFIDRTQDGGVSTAATVADGGPSGQKEDPTYQPPAEVAEAGSDMNAKPGESTRSKT